MAHAQRETRTRTVEETVVVLTISEDEADSLRLLIDRHDTRGALSETRAALESPGTTDPGTTAIHNAVTYDLRAQYRDTDGDVWVLRRSPSDPRVIQAQIVPAFDDDWDVYTLQRVADQYGPLVQVSS